MLKQLTHTTPYIGVFKLHSGEEFIAKVMSVDTFSIKVEKPLCMVNTPNGPSFAPLFMLGDLDAPTTINKVDFIETTPGTQVKSMYESVTSGIALPPQNGLVTK
jgi:hypothetical protein